MPMMGRWRFAACVALLAVGGPGMASGQGDGLIVGVCTHFSQGKGVVELNLGMISQASIGSIRDEVSWGAVEREQGRLVMP